MRSQDYPRGRWLMWKRLVFGLQFKFLENRKIKPRYGRASAGWRLICAALNPQAHGGSDAGIGIAKPDDPTSRANTLPMSPLYVVNYAERRNRHSNIVTITTSRAQPPF